MSNGLGTEIGDDDIMRIGSHVAKHSRLKDKEEALAIALLGIARGLTEYDCKVGVKLTTFLYKCAQYEVWVEWRKQNRIKRGRDVVILSLDELEERGIII